MPSKLISKLCKGYLRYVKCIMVSRSICRIKLSTFTHQFAYNSPESDVEFEIEQKSKHEKCKTQPKKHWDQITLFY